jgi:hypothetical protein
MYDDVFLAGRVADSVTTSKVTLGPKIVASTASSVDYQTTGQLAVSGLGLIEVTATNGTETYVTLLMLDSQMRYNQTHEIYKIRNANNEEIEIVVALSMIRRSRCLL